MIRAEGRVVMVDGAHVLVEIPERAAACGNCKSAGGCHTGLLGLTGNDRRVRVANRIGARLHDRVSLGVTEGNLLRASWYSYLLPALLAIAGAGAGQTLGGDIPALAGTVFGLIVGFTYLRLVGQRASAKGAMLSLERPRVAACHVSESE